MEVNIMKNSTLKLVLSIVGAVVVLGAITAAVIHFWDDIKRLLPCGKSCCEESEFADIEE